MFFCDPHGPWQRGSNENTNRLLRQYLAKGADLRQFSLRDLDDIAHRINTRPRRVLDWATSAELFWPRTGRVRVVRILERAVQRSHLVRLSQASRRAAPLECGPSGFILRFG